MSYSPSTAWYPHSKSSPVVRLPATGRRGYKWPAIPRKRKNRWLGVTFNRLSSLLRPTQKTTWPPYKELMKEFWSLWVSRFQGLCVLKEKDNTQPMMKLERLLSPGRLKATHSLCVLVLMVLMVECLTQRPLRTGILTIQRPCKDPP